MTAYETFVTDAGRVDVFLAEVAYQPPATVAAGLTTEATLRYATAKYAGPFPTDTTPDEVYQAIMAEEIRWRSAAPNLDTVGILLPDGGGEVVVANGKGDLDGARSAGWLFDGRRIVVRHVGYSPRLKRWLTVAEGRVILRGEVEQPLFSDGLVRFVFRDHAERLKQPLCPRKFAGGTYCKPLAAAQIDLGTDVTAAKLGATGPLTFGARLMLTATGTNTIISWDNVVTTDNPFTVRFRGASLNDMFFMHRKASAQVSATLTTLVAALGEWYTAWWVVNGTSVIGYLVRDRTGAVATEEATLSDGTRVAPAAGSALRIGCTAGVQAPGLVLDWLQVRSGAMTLDRCIELSKPLDAAERLDASLLYYADLEEGGAVVAIRDQSPAPLADGVASDATWRKSLGGGDNLAGSAFPEVWGPGSRRLPAILVEGTENHYAVCSDQIGDVTGATCNDGGAALTLGTTYTTFASYAAAAAPGAGNFAILNSPAGVFVRTNTAPSYPLAVTFPGGQVSVGLGSAPAGPGAIARNLLIDRCGFVSDDLDEDSFAELDADVGPCVGVYADPSATAGDAIGRALSSVGACLVRLRSGLLAARRIRDPDGGPVAVAFTERDLSPPKPLPSQLPVALTIVSYSPNLVPLDQGSQSASLTAAERLDLEQASRTVRRPRSAATHRLGRTLRRETSLNCAAAAAQLAQHLEGLGLTYGSTYQTDANARGFLADVLDVVSIKYSLPHYLTGYPTPRVFSEIGERFLVLSAQDGPTGPTLVLWRVGVPAVIVETAGAWLVTDTGEALLFVR